MSYFKIILLLLTSLFFISCNNKVKIPDNKKPIVVEEKLVSIADNNSTDANVKEKSNSSKLYEKSIALKKKLSRCGIRYDPWKDRLNQDLKLLPKVLSVCKNVRHYTKGYILHSTRKKGNSSFTQGKNVYLKYYSSKKDIKKYLSKLRSIYSVESKPRFTVDNGYLIRGNSNLRLGKPYQIKLK